MSKEYRRWVASLPCCVSGMRGEVVDPHHIIGHAHITGKSMSKKGSDLTCIPLRSDLHAELHRVGHTTFEHQQNISQIAVMIQTILLAEHEGIITIDNALAQRLYL